MCLCIDMLSCKGAFNQPQLPMYMTDHVNARRHFIAPVIFHSMVTDGSHGGSQIGKRRAHKELIISIINAFIGYTLICLLTGFDMVIKMTANEVGQII